MKRRLAKVAFRVAFLGLNVIRWFHSLRFIPVEVGCNWIIDKIGKLLMGDAYEKNCYGEEDALEALREERRRKKEKGGGK